MLERTVHNLRIVTDNKGVQQRAEAHLEGTRNAGVSPREHHVDLWRRFAEAAKGGANTGGLDAGTFNMERG